MNKTIQSILALILLWQVSFAKENTNRQLEQTAYLQKANQALVQGKPNEALLFTDSILKVGGPNALAHLIRGFAYSKIGNWDSAETSLNSVKKSGKGIEQDIAKLFLAYLYYDNKPIPNFVASAKSLASIEKQSRLYDEAQISLGWCFIKVQKPSEASEYFNDVIRRSKDSVFIGEAHYGLAATLGFKKKSEKAIDEANKVLEFQLPKSRFGFKLKNDSIYNIREIKYNAQILKADLLCSSKKDPKICQELEILIGKNKPYQMDKWISGKQRIIEDIDVFLGGLISEPMKHEYGG